MILLGIFAALLIADIALFAFDRYVISFWLLIGSIAGAIWLAPELLALLATYGYWQVGAAYLVAGLAVALVKWVAVLVKHTFKIRAARAAFKLAVPTTPQDTVPSRQLAFAKYWNENCEYGRVAALCPRINTASCYEDNFNNPDYIVSELTLRAKRNVERISFWVLQWPIVILATIFEDLIINIGRRAASIFDLCITRLSQAMIANSIKDL